MVEANSRVRVGGAAIVTVATPTLVSGCANQQAPCVRISWIQGNGRVTAAGVPIVTQHSAGLVLAANGTPAGAPIVTTAAERVIVG